MLLCLHFEIATRHIVFRQHSSCWHEMVKRNIFRASYNLLVIAVRLCAGYLPQCTEEFLGPAEPLVITRNHSNRIVHCLYMSKHLGPFMDCWQFGTLGRCFDRNFTLFLVFCASNTDWFSSVIGALYCASEGIPR